VRGFPPERLFFLFLFLMGVLSLDLLPAYAQRDNSGSYEELVQRNLDLRKKLNALEERYISLENERNVLILHVRNLQEEKSRLAASTGLSAAPAQAGDEMEARYSELKAAFAEVSKELGLVAKERDILRGEFLSLKKQQEADEERIKTLESEKTELAVELDKVRGMFKENRQEGAAVRPDTGLSAAPAHAGLRVQEEENGEAKEKDCQTDRDMAIQQALYRAREEQLKTEYASLAAACERLKADLKAKQKLLAREGRRGLAEKRRWEKKIVGITKAKEAAEKKRQEAQRARKKAEAAMRVIKKELDEQRILQRRQAARGKTGGVSGEKRTTPDRTGGLAPAHKQSLDMHYNLALAYHKTGMYKEEEREYVKCLEINPNDAIVHYNLAILYDDKFNDNAKAVKHYKKYLELEPAGEDVEKVKQWMLYAEGELRLGGGG
jgi:tetratricopeptide (TPR) repeat protein